MAVLRAFKVDGLNCSEEVAILRREVGRLSGVVEMEFDVVNARMSVEYDPETVSAEKIVSAVAATGMKAAPWAEREKQETVPFWRRHGRLVMAVLSGSFLIAGFLTHWALHGSLIDAFAGGHHEQHMFPLPSVILYVASVVAGAWFVFPKALRAAGRVRPDMNLLMVVAAVGALLIGEWFEAATVSFLFAVSLLLEHWSVERARNAISALLDLSPTLARCLQPETGEAVEGPVEEVPVGATVLVRPGEKIPLDGIVTKGTSTVNQAPITGESLPVSKGLDDEVFAGTINEDGALEFRTTRPANDTTLARIIHMVQEAQSRRAPAQQWVDRFATYYTPAMMALAAAIALVPPLLFSAAWEAWIYRGLVILVIACPCALVISTPVSIVSALTASARNGVLVKGGMYVEAAGRLQVLALDKTGTLTYGRPEVQAVLPLNRHTPGELLERAAALESCSEHPLARAVLRKAEAQGIRVPPAECFQAIRGMGAEGRINGRLFWIGSHRMMHDKGQETPEVHRQAEDLEDAGHTVVAVGSDDHVCGLISVADGVRDGAAEAVRRLREIGVRKVVMLTGDNEGTARAVAAATAVDEYRSELLPQDKVQAVESLVRDYGQVAMVGDGINDAPALAVANVGIAMGAMGTDAAIETADVALMSDDLSKLSWLILHSRRTLRIIKTNIIFALGLKLLFIVLTLLGAASLWMAIAADTGASLLVIFNGLRLLGKRGPRAASPPRRDVRTFGGPDRPGE